MKTKQTFGFFLGIAALAAAIGLLPGCQNPSASQPAPEPVSAALPEGMGRLSLTLGLAGPAASVRQARTAFPTSIGISSYTVSFEPKKDGQAHAPVTFSGAATDDIKLITGTYVVTVEGSNSAGNAIAQGTKTVVIAEGQTTTASITMGPKANAGKGTVTFKQELPSDVRAPILTITPLTSDIPVDGGMRILTPGTTSNESLSLDSGYYKARFEVTVGGAVGGFNNEFIHVYAGLTSDITPLPVPLPVPQPIEVTDFNLTPYFAAPMTWDDPDPSFFDKAPQYDGIIRWKANGADHSGSFAGNTVYTAVIELIATQDYTFTGVSDPFSHGGLTGVSTDNTGKKLTVTIVFPATKADGALSIAIGYNHGDIVVSGSNEVNTIYRNDVPSELSLKVEGYEKISWSVDTGPAKEANPFVVSATDKNGANYALDLGLHYVTFNGYKDGVPFSKRIPFTVAFERFFLPSVEKAAAYLDSVTGQGGNAGDPILLPMKMDLGNGTDTFAKLLSVIAAKGKYVEVDLSLCYNAPDTTFNPDSTDSTGKDLVVSLVLPDGAESIVDGSGPSATFKFFTSLKSVTGSTVTTIGNYAFSYVCTALVTVDFPEARSIGEYAFASCTALATVDFPEVVSINTAAFISCTALATAKFPKAGSLQSHCFLRTETMGLSLTLPKNAPSLGTVAGSTYAYTKTVTIKVPTGSTGYDETWQTNFKKAFGKDANIQLIIVEE
ncbi:MAG: leucine-rich repeat domain-containing protein [Spirochaetaceae bacterium]|nr:leucine-rich repeat domain-containing protein [Spirochaetaceae bacterium]